MPIVISPEQEALKAQQDAMEVYRYVVWAIIPENAKARVLKVMEALREEFGGPEIEPHFSIVGSSLMPEDEAIDAFKSACTEVKQFYCQVENLETSKYYYQCVSLVIEITDDLKNQTRWLAGSMRRPLTTMLHLNLLYGNLSEEEKQRAKEKVVAIR